jgi:hypothetical protein
LISLGYFASCEAIVKRMVICCTVDPSSASGKSPMDRRDCLYPECLIATDFGSACEHSCPFEAEFKRVGPKPKPYSRGCLARDIPGASCQSPNCDC